MKTYRLIDELDEIIYVSDPVTYELLYLNETGVSALGDNYRGKLCYRFLQGMEGPCPFCTNRYLLENNVRDHFYVWEHTNEHAGGHHYLIKDKLIEWEGKPARLELAIDITEKENVSKAVQEKLKVENVLMDCIRALVQEKNFDRAINIVLSSIGKLYQAERVYIFELQENSYLRNTYEQCAEGVVPQISRLQRIEKSDMESWFQQFRKGQVVRIVDLDMELVYDSMEYRLLKPQDIHSLLAVPLCQDGEIWGCIGMDNPVWLPEDCSPLDSLAFFITEFIQKRRIEDHMNYVSCHDSLSGLYNRYQYTEKLQSLAVAPPASIGVVFVDIDGLKKINDDYGHGYGDLYITETADILRGHFPEEALYRIGGDEFVVLYEGVSREDFNECCAAAERAYSTRERCRVSIGYIWSDRKVDIYNLTNSADELMYLNKQNAYQKHLLSDFHHKPAQLDELLKSLQAGEFEINLQVKMDTRKEYPIGAEALVRQRTPKLGMIQPDQFIHLLEKELIIKYVDFYVCEKVCQMLEGWKRQYGHVLPVSVNFSRLTLMEPQFVEQLLSIREKYDFPPESLELEITESTDKMGYDNMIRVVREIRQNGFRIALDDFGTKYTSLSLFTEMDVDVVKLDKSLVDGLETNPKSRIIVKDAVQMCRELGAKSIAEGVETFRQLEILRALGCDQVQGYYYSKPLPVEKFEETYCRGCYPAERMDQ